MDVDENRAIEQCRRAITKVIGIEPEGSPDPANRQVILRYFDKVENLERLENEAKVLENRKDLRGWKRTLRQLLEPMLPLDERDILISKASLIREVRDQLRVEAPATLRALENLVATDFRIPTQELILVLTAFKESSVPPSLADGDVSGQLTLGASDANDGRAEAPDQPGQVTPEQTRHGDYSRNLGTVVPSTEFTEAEIFLGAAIINGQVQEPDHWVSGLLRRKKGRPPALHNVFFAFWIRVTPEDKRTPSGFCSFADKYNFPLPEYGSLKSDYKNWSEAGNDEDSVLHKKWFADAQRFAKEVGVISENIW